MISFFESSEKNIFAVQSNKPLSEQHCKKLQWLFGNAKKLKEKSIVNNFIGPRSSMISPWSTNAVEICENMGIDGIARIEKYFYYENSNFSFDPMTNEKFKCLDQNIFKLNITPVEILEIKNIRKYNLDEGLALSHDEVEFLEDVAKKIGRNLTDSEVFGFSQVNSEHCRHKIFNGTFIIDKEVKKESLFSLIKKTSKLNSKNLVSAYKDNVAFIVGPEITQFAPKNSSFSDFYESKKIDSVISLKAETHNFPTTVEPFNGAATGSGGEIRDRLAGGKGSLPIAGTAVYMTPYSRVSDYPWEKSIDERNWLYQNPSDILIKASNGASDFGNKFGQPLICGSVLTFENKFENNIQSFDKVIMLAGGMDMLIKIMRQKRNQKKVI